MAFSPKHTPKSLGHRNPRRWLVIAGVLVTLVLLLLTQIGIRSKHWEKVAEKLEGWDEQEIQEDLYVSFFSIYRRNWSTVQTSPEF